jgi:hypothetical protein
MQSLLRWSIENSTTSTTGSGDVTASPQATRRTDLDPGIIDAILGRPDSELMKEALAKAQNASLDEDARLTALDDLEMLVENIDNANDLEKLGMWEPLQDLVASSPEDMKVQALWVIGTAVQNNPAAQKAYLAIDPLATILSYLSPLAQSSKQLRSKAIYTLSGLLKHNAAAIAQFEAVGGWDTLRDAFSDSDIAVRRKAAFLLNNLLIPSSPAATTRAPGTRIRGGPAQPEAIVHPNSHASMVADPTSTDTAPETLRAVRAHGLLPAIVRELTEPTPYGPDGDEGDGCDADLEEKLMRLLHTYVSAHDGTFDDPEKSTLRTFLDARRATSGESELGLGADELREIRNALA